MGILDPRGRHDVHHRIPFFCRSSPLACPGRTRCPLRRDRGNVTAHRMEPGSIIPQLLCSLGPLWRRAGKLYPKVVGVVELRSIRHRYDELLQRRPVEPLRALCPDQVGDEGIDVVAPGQAFAGDLIEAPRQPDQIRNLMSRARNLGRKTAHHRRTAARSFLISSVGAGGMVIPSQNDVLCKNCLLALRRQAKFCLDMTMAYDWRCSNSPNGWRRLVAREIPWRR